MFPAYSLSTFSTVTRPENFSAEDPNGVMNNAAYVYAIGLFTQLTSLHELATMIFKDISNEFNTVSNRLGGIKSRVETFKQNADPILTKNQTADPLSFANKNYSPISPDMSVLAPDAVVSSRSSVAQKLIDEANPTFSMKAWEDIVRDYTSLDCYVTYPQVFEGIFQAEMKQKFKDMQKSTMKKEKKAKKKEKVVEDKGSSRALTIFINKVFPPQQLLLFPPPKGNGTKSRPQLHFNVQSPSALPSSSETPSYSQKPTFQQQPQQSYETPQQQTQSSGGAPPPPPPPPPPPAPGIKLPPSQPIQTTPSEPVQEDNNQLVQDLGGGGAPPPAAGPPKIAPPKAQNRPPPPPDQPNFLDLIKTGNYKLKKVDTTQPPPPSPKFAKKEDTNQLTAAELLQKMAEMRADIAESDSDSETESSSDSSW